MGLPEPARVRVADGDAWQVRHGDVVLRFGIGPPTHGDRGAARASRVAADGGWRAASAEQVHGARLATVGAGGSRPAAGCDGLATDAPDVALVIWTADCVPVLLAAGGVVAAVHAGWRGTAAGIVPAAVALLERRYGVPPGDLVAWLGPAVCGRHYEVGPEVVAALAACGVPDRLWRRDRHVDLRALIRRQLERCGVASSAIGAIDACTVEDPALASYRRDGAAAGRQWSLAVRCSPLS